MKTQRHGEEGHGKTEAELEGCVFTSGSRKDLWEPPESREGPGTGSPSEIPEGTNAVHTSIPDPDRGPVREPTPGVLGQQR